MSNGKVRVRFPMILNGGLVQMGTEVKMEALPARLRRELFIEAVVKKKGPRMPQERF